MVEHGQTKQSMYLLTVDAADASLQPELDLMMLWLKKWEAASAVVVASLGQLL